MTIDSSSEMPPVKRGRLGKGISDVEDDDEDYRKRRDRNNEAVKKSRYKSKQRTQETFSRVSKLKEENQMLEEKVKTLNKDLQFLKDLFIEYANNFQSSKLEGLNLEKLLEDVDDEETSTSKNSKS